MVHLLGLIVIKLNNYISYITISSHIHRINYLFSLI